MLNLRLLQAMPNDPQARSKQKASPRRPWNPIFLKRPMRPIDAARSQFSATARRAAHQGPGGRSPDPQFVRDIQNAFLAKSTRIRTGQSPSQSAVKFGELPYGVQQHMLQHAMRFHQANQVQRQQPVYQRNRGYYEQPVVHRQPQYPQYPQYQQPQQFYPMPVQQVPQRQFGRQMTVPDPVQYAPSSFARPMQPMQQPFAKPPSVRSEAIATNAIRQMLSANGIDALTTPNFAEMSNGPRNGPKRVDILVPSHDQMARAYQSLTGNAEQWPARNGQSSEFESVDSGSARARRPAGGSQ